jgi:uncharacterized membrane protein (UPF0127 family)
MKMFLEILLLIIAVVILVCLFFYYAQISLSPNSQQYSSGSVCIMENCFQVELAKTEAQREKGLMYRKELDKNKGILFIFDKEGIYPFWMKNTLIPLDMLWIDASPAGGNKVVFISQNTEPCKSLLCPSVVPLAKANYVLEINAGISKNLGIKIGDIIELNIK